MANRVAGERSDHTQEHKLSLPPNKQMVPFKAMILVQGCKVELGNEKKKMYLILRCWDKASFI